MSQPHHVHNVLLYLVISVNVASYTCFAGSYIYLWQFCSTYMVSLSHACTHMHAEALYLQDLTCLLQLYTYKVLHLFVAALYLQDLISICCSFILTRSYICQLQLCTYKILHPFVIDLYLQDPTPVCGTSVLTRYYICLVVLYLQDLTPVWQYCTYKVLTYGCGSLNLRGLHACGSSELTKY